MKNSIYGAFFASKIKFFKKNCAQKGEQQSVKVEIPFTKIKILRKGADFMMQNTVIGVILTIMSMILVTSYTSTRKLSITEMVALSDKNAESLR